MQYDKETIHEAERQAALSTMTYDEVEAYVMARTKPITDSIIEVRRKGGTTLTGHPHSSMRIVTSPMHVFKAVQKRGIANLIIPVGAVIFYDKERWKESGQKKLRASKAYVHSIVDRNTGNQLTRRNSLWNAPRVEYRVGRTIYPNNFAFSGVTCGPGIHFFVDLNDALTYRW